MYRQRACFDYKSAAIVSLDQKMEQNALKKLKLFLEYQGDMGLESIPMKKTSVGKKAAPAGSSKSPDKSASLLKSTLDDLKDCKRCVLAKGRTNLVFGEGNPGADLMFVGEGPGADEDAQGLPFVGRAGQLLTKIIEAMGYKRSDVYIANIVKCRPPNNRAPEPEEINACMPFLLRQIEAIKPKVIICLGSVAMQSLLGTAEKISQVRGKMREFHGIELMPTYHPAYLLRNPEKKKDVWEDVKKVMARLKG